jgi:hypothetical protein
MTNLLQAAGFTWTPEGDCTVAATVDGNTYLVHVPSASVRFELRKACRLEGLDFANEVGDVDILGWFGGKIWRKAKKAVKKVTKAVTKKVKAVAKRTISSVRKAANTGVRLWKATSKYAGKALANKYVGGLVLASAAVCPAIGGPALAAYSTARAAYSTYRAGGAAAQAVASNVRRLAQGRYPTVNQRLLTSAFRSYYQ